MPSSSLSPTVRDARADFFSANDFGDGGYNDAYAEASFGHLTYRVPNPPARAVALKLHDLHHVLTGYDTDWRGEAEISAWEVGSGFDAPPWARMIMLWGMFTGLMLAPVDTVRAFLRGRRSSNLYSRRYDEALLSRELADLEAELGVVPADADPWSGLSGRERLADVVSLGGWVAASLSYGALGLVPSLSLVAFAWMKAVRQAIHWVQCPMGCPMTAARGA